MSTMMRQIMTLFDEYQSRENAKHTLRAMKENARQGFRNGSRPPLGYRIVVAEQRGAKLKKKLEIDPIQAEKIRLIYRLALFGIGPMGLKSIANYLNDQNIRTPDGGRFGIDSIHKILNRPTYKGEHHFNAREADLGTKLDWIAVDHHNTTQHTRTPISSCAASLTMARPSTSPATISPTAFANGPARS
jgi:site-specific DNA recombinase